MAGPLSWTIAGAEYVVPLPAIACSDQVARPATFQYTFRVLCGPSTTMSVPVCAVPPTLVDTAMPGAEYVVPFPPTTDRRHAPPRPLSM